MLFSLSLLSFPNALLTTPHPSIPSIIVLQIPPIIPSEKEREKNSNSSLSGLTDINNPSGATLQPVEPLYLSLSTTYWTTPPQLRNDPHRATNTTIGAAPTTEQPKGSHWLDYRRQWPTHYWSSKPRPSSCLVEIRTATSTKHLAVVTILSSHCYLHNSST